MSLRLEPATHSSESLPCSTSGLREPGKWPAGLVESSNYPCGGSRMSITPPREGMLATVRNRRALITSVADSPAQRGEVSRIVRVEYMDAAAPSDDDVLWDLEPGAEVVEPRRLPKVDVEPPMHPRDFDSVTRSARWMALSPYVGTQGLPEGASPLAAPLFGSIQVEDYQLVPLVQALKMPRVSMALFDDVGLGKSVEAGLVLSELILRRRLRRVLVICPAWLRHQWQEELRSCSRSSP